MKKLTPKIILLALLVLNYASLTYAQAEQDKFEPIYAIVLADQVNVRAGLGLNFEILAQLGQGSEVVVVGQKYDWYKIKLPEQAQCFVHADYIEGGVVQADKLRVRAGKGINFNILALLTKGDRVSVLEAQGQWLKIAPPKNSAGWVKKDYLRLTGKKFIRSVPKPAVAEPKLVEQNKNIEVLGIIDELGKIFNRQGTHKLLIDNKPHYYLKSEKVNLNLYVYQKVYVVGEPLAPGDSPYPIIDVQRIRTRQ